MSIIYHYTNMKGLSGILGSNKTSGEKQISLWFTRSDYLNDTSEGSNIKVIYDDVLNEMKESNRITDKQYCALKTLDFDAPSTFLFDSKEEPNTICPHIGGYDVFICSFSKKPDDLNMWRCYPKGGDGCCIGFRRDVLEAAMDYKSPNSAPFPLCKVRWHDVVYDDTKKKAQVLTIIDDKLSFFGGEDEKALVNLVISTQYELCFMKYSFKHSCFASEQEVRGIVLVPKKKINGVRNLPISIKTRERNGERIPYIVWSFDISVLASVLLSPVASEAVVSAAQNNVNRFLDGAYGGMEVTKSHLPVNSLN